MVSNFYSDLEKAHGAEVLVQQVLSGMTDFYTFEDVANDKEYYHKGDIKAIGKDGTITMIEVKDDSRIGDTHNILCEESVLYYWNNERVKGNFYSNYEIYSVVSKRERKIYLFDFKELQKIYRKGRRMTLSYSEQESDVYLLPLEQVKGTDAYLGIINY